MKQVLGIAAILLMGLGLMAGLLLALPVIIWLLEVTFWLVVIIVAIYGIGYIINALLNN